MKKLISVMLIALAVGGCSVHMPNGTTVRILSQVGITVRVVNNCAPIVDIESSRGVVVAGLPFSGSHSVAWESDAWSGNYRKMFLTAKGYSADRQLYFGSYTKEFTINVRDGSKAEPWEINNLHLPGAHQNCVKPPRMPRQIFGKGGDSESPPFFAAKMLKCSNESNYRGFTRRTWFWQNHFRPRVWENYGSGGEYAKPHLCDNEILQYKLEGI